MTLFYFIPSPPGVLLPTPAATSFPLTQLPCCPPRPQPYPGACLGPPASPLSQGPVCTCTDKAREPSVYHFLIVREDKGAPGLHLQAVLLAGHPALAFLLGHAEVF